MIRVHVLDLKIGDCLGTDTFNNYGLLIISAGKLLDHGDISSLIRHNIDYVDVELPKAAPVAPRSLEEELLERFTEATAGMRDMFEQAAADGALDMKTAERYYAPLMERLSQEKDIVSLLLTLSDQDDYTYQHCVHVGMLSYFIAKWMGKSESDAVLAGKAGYLHDIGKCKIDTAILNKPGKLTAEEYTEIKRHTEYGFELIEKAMPRSVLGIVALQHHERFNGRGYPHGITESSMHPVSKIVAVADIYSAMTSNRVYQKRRDLLDVLKELYQLSFSEIDPTATQVFIRNMMPNFIGKQVRFTDGQIGKIVMIPPNDPFRPLVRIDKKFISLAEEPQLQIERIEFQEDQ